jgi:hypothetical protein
MARIKFFGKNVGAMMEGRMHGTFALEGTEVTDVGEVHAWIMVVAGCTSMAVIMETTKGGGTSLLRRPRPQYCFLCAWSPIRSRKKISWQIMDITKGKPKAVPGCSGSRYETWYANMKTGCKLRNGKRYQVTCRDNKYSEGWAGGYLKISNLKVCGNWAWNAKSKSKKVKLVAKKSVKVMRR